MGVTSVTEAGNEVDNQLGGGLHIVLVAIVSVHQGHVIFVRSLSLVGVPTPPVASR